MNEVTLIVQGGTALIGQPAKQGSNALPIILLLLFLVGIVFGFYYLNKPKPLISPLFPRKTW